ncbi:MAG: hypothetical protein JXQ96_20745 [Cyclobacteriaceae bacterium]
MKFNTTNTKHLDLRLFCDESDDSVTHMSLKYGESKNKLNQVETAHFSDPFDKGENAKSGLINELQKLLNTYFEE